MKQIGTLILLALGSGILAIALPLFSGRQRLAKVSLPNQLEG
jgi:hypothetical protein